MPVAVSMISKAREGDPTQNQLEEAIGQAKAVATEDDCWDEDYQELILSYQESKSATTPTKKTQQIIL